MKINQVNTPFSLENEIVYFGITDHRNVLSLTIAITAYGSTEIIL